MIRRDFLTLLGGAAVAWPVVARAQQVDAKRVAVLIGLVESDPQVPPRIAAIRDGLQSHGWVVGRNIRFDFTRESLHQSDHVPNRIFEGTTGPAPPHQLSRKLLRVLDRLGCFGFRSALASICLMRSRVNENCWPTSSSV
jgi:hypothetical protein